MVERAGGVGMPVPNFSRPGEEGEVPERFREWECGVTYTARPELLEPVPPHQELLLNVTTRRITSAPTEATSYADLYERALAIAHARAARVGSTHAQASKHTRIVAQAWFSNDAGRARIDSASVTVGVTFLRDAIPMPAGEKVPEPAELAVPSRGNPETFATRHLDDSGSRLLHELYIDFVRSDTRDVTVSYGEYVEACGGVDFAPILARAEALARFHAVMTSPLRREVPLRILRREWNCLATGKSDGSHVATVHLYFHRE